MVQEYIIVLYNMRITIIISNTIFLNLSVFYEYVQVTCVWEQFSDIGLAFALV